MASTSTNKQPCLIDRPFLRGAKINSGTSTVDPTNPSFANLVQLVRVGDLPTEDAKSPILRISSIVGTNPRFDNFTNASVNSFT